ncbi:uncharacterized protein EDB91DRAFT_1209805 [Suillus paluster]|uniref:uncharacterized protein n=1 Tax=Suillus paluster TaxID=48578 RepID=UPI001B8661E4|nr:uncharacterized protein EDB91DRAFT_1209805 [Suillus paluster]KAG1723237.1 hypothetical protein EDB91DRAFT_1209805 [Suillus paluster]
MHSSYSPLFTLGLLAERRAGISSPNRKQSIPSSSCSGAPHKAHPAAAADDHASAFYFTLQTGQRDTVEFRSFLSLDLADSNRSIASHRRKPSTMSKSTSWTCTSDITSARDLSRIERPAFALLPPLPSACALRRSSRESLRQIPSPKPAPISSTLPEPPTAPNSSPPSKSLPSATNPSFSAPLLSPTVSSGKVSSLRSSSITSHQRRKSHMDALACLEGRSRAANRIPRSNLRNNFMSMSDDEDDDPKTPSSLPNAPFIQIEDFGSFADIEDEGDVIASSPEYRSPKQATFPRTVSQPVKRQRRGTVDSWFPLKSFIDLKDDDLSWNWRSFIEISSV